MGLLSVISFAQQTLKARIRPGEPVIDATAGGGNDTVFLARCVGPLGTVYAFDIQQAALEETKARLEREGLVDADVRLLLASHADLKGHMNPEHDGRVGAAMFNLGYLPGSDRQLITKPESTVPALEAAFDGLRSGGVLSLVLYPGHQGGDEEALIVEAWAAGLPGESAQVMSYRSLNRRESRPPYLILVEKKG